MPRTKKSGEKETNVKEKIKAKKEKAFVGTGRRKSAVASVFLYPKKGDFIVNDKEISEFFRTEKEKLSYLRPFHLVGVSHPESSYSATIKVSGSGTSSQLSAVVLGLSRALIESNPEYRDLLRKYGLLTRDPREVERKKYFLRKARKRPQYSKR